MRATYYAHSENEGGTWHTLVNHLRGVATLAGSFAQPLDLTASAELAGLLHDLGKYGDLFQDRLRGLASKVDHWSAGAWEALCRKDPLAAVAIHGHHVGLRRLDKDALRALEPARLAAQHPDGLSLSDSDSTLLVARLEADGLGLPTPTTNPAPIAPAATGMLDARMLYSTLVDADFLDTEAHFADAGNDLARPTGPPLEPERAFSVLQTHLELVRQRSAARTEVNAVRDALWRACEAASQRPIGLYTLSAPTGAGKTLAMLGFALAHAAKHGLRRIVVVIPYLTIIEQTAQVYREILEPHFGPDYVLEHHSLADTHAKEHGSTDEASSPASRLLAENWDAPLIVTTSVQFLESLFAARSAACRKLHRIARSVVLFDEVQTLPVHLTVPSLATLAHLSARYSTTVVLSTATQPAFSHLDVATRELGAPGWRTVEAVDDGAQLFHRARRTTVRWSDPDVRIGWDIVASRLAGQQQTLCIVNLKRHAAALVEELRDQGAGAGLYHLSTSMCPHHRRAVLAEVRERLASGAPCRLVSTQCVEAGVDVDFPVVHRAFGPLEAIAQAAGRCNREGRCATGEVIVFTPDDDRGLYPSPTYALAASITTLLLRERGEQSMDINDPSLFDVYYRRLYDLAQPQEMRRELLEAIKARDFEMTARLYRLIEQDAINILVPHDEGAFARLAAEVRRRGLTRRWMREAQLHTVSLFRPQPKDPVWDQLERTVVRRRKASEVSDHWFIYLERAHYDDLMGLQPVDAPAVWVI